MDVLVVSNNFLSSASIGLMILCAINIGYSLKISLLIIIKYVERGGGAVFMKLMVLIPDMIGNVIRTVALYDLLGLRGKIPFVIGRIFITLHVPLGFFSKFSFLLVWLDAIKSMKNVAFSNGARTSVLLSNNVVRYSVCSLLRVSV